MVLNFQEGLTGPMRVSEHGNLMIYLLAAKAHMRGSATFNQPYVEPVRCALDWTVGRDSDATTFPSLESISKVVTFTAWGRKGLGGLTAYEEDVGAAEA